MQNPVSLLIDMLSPRGRISRRFFLPIGLGYVAVWWTIWTMTRSINMGLSGTYGPLGDTWMDLIFTYGVFCLYAKRSHDVGWPAILAGVVLAPWPISYALKAIGHYVPLPNIIPSLALMFSGVMAFANLALFVVIAVWPGQKADNRYGDNPRSQKRDGIQVEAF